MFKKKQKKDEEKVVIEKKADNSTKEKLVGDIGQKLSSNRPH